MADSKEGMRKPVFSKVEQLRPGTSGHNLVVKVVDAKLVMQRGRPDGQQLRQMRLAECLVGDETGIIVFTARNDQDGHYCDSHEVIIHEEMCVLTNWDAFVLPVDKMIKGSTVTMRNAKIDMFKGSMRLAGDKWGRIEEASPADFSVKEDNNLSLIEYELVNIVEG
ncbi:uncharacterized protein At4g28440-like isoform X1 [Silene latifolia]|uniref:uncharacterized protein At4g28440-like isoform X1 n=1 Tax=Silene latifolia TaxID=37657 RepID=UPI003D781662